MIEPTNQTTSSQVLNTCPVIDLANDILSCHQDILRKIRRFKNKARTTCKHCEKFGACEQLNFINQQIAIAIREVMAEWGL